MPTFRGVECFIATPSGRLFEFAEPNESEPSPVTKTVYIQADSASTFNINVHVKKFSEIAVAKANCVALEFIFDGVSQQPRGLSPEQRGKTYRWEGVKRISGRDGQWELLRFRFDDVRVADADEEDMMDGHIGMDPERVEALGEIKVVAMRFKTGGPKIQPTPPTPSMIGLAIESGEGVVHEKTVKGRDVQRLVRLESAQRTDPQAYFQGECIDTFEEPFIIFRFLYRSERALMNLGLLPYPMDFFPPDRKAFVLRDLSAEPPALAAMTSEQIEAFLARRKQKEQDEMMAEVKVEREVHIKREASSPSPGAKKRRKTGGYLNTWNM